MPELNVKHVPAIPPIASPGPSRTNPLANRRQLTLMIASAIAYVVGGAPTVAGFARRNTALYRNNQPFHF